MPATVIRLPVVFREPLSEPLPPTPHPVAHDPLWTGIAFGAGLLFCLGFWAGVTAFAFGWRP